MENRYYEVVGFVTVDRFLDSYTSTNEWYGSTELFRRNTIPFELDQGTEIHDLHGGTFVIIKGKPIEVKHIDRKVLRTSTEEFEAKHRTVIDQYRE